MVCSCAFADLFSRACFNVTTFFSRFQTQTLHLARRHPCCSSIKLATMFNLTGMMPVAGFVDVTGALHHVLTVLFNLQISPCFFSQTGNPFACVMPAAGVIAPQVMNAPHPPTLLNSTSTMTGKKLAFLASSTLLRPWGKSYRN